MVGKRKYSVEIAKARRAYLSQFCSARRRGIPFLLSFDEWYVIWQQSGHWLERGRKLGQYCMARYFDGGPYSKDNVKIILHRSNIIEGNLGRKHIFTPEHRINLSKAKAGLRGHPMSERTKQILRAAKHRLKRSKPSC